MTVNTVHTLGSSIPARLARVSKRLLPGQNGTKRHQSKYGNALVCLRYRQDGRKRYTPIELVIDEQALPPRSVRLEDIVAVALCYPAQELRAEAKKSGAHWDADRRTWLMPRATAKALGIEGRIQSGTGNIQ
jgi:hypothetical protein